MFNRILVGLENTPASKTAFEYAVRLARQERAELHVISVGSIPEITAGTIDEIRDAQRHAQAELVPLVKAGRELAEAKGQPVVTDIRFGHAADVINAYAAEHGVDLIVLGKQRRHLGSVGERVIRHAHALCLWQARPRSLNTQALLIIEKKTGRFAKTPVKS
ncbi:MAG TPA: universal stress protein [Blastocatellia bacterium]|nr:universal stress protein [Blastocatellia bacterium]